MIQKILSIIAWVWRQSYIQDLLTKNGEIKSFLWLQIIVKI